MKWKAPDSQRVYFIPQRQQRTGQCGRIYREFTLYIRLLSQIVVTLPNQGFKLKIDYRSAKNEHFSISLPRLSFLCGRYFEELFLCTMKVNGVQKQNGIELIFIV